MTMRNLDFFFAPTSIALVGADRTPATAAGVLTANLFGGGFKGKIFTVDTAADIAGLPQAPDLAVIATPDAETVPQLIAELGKLGTKAALVFSPAFGHSSDAQGQSQGSAILASAKPYLLRIIGANSLGIMVPKVGLNASTSHIQPLAGNLAFVSQSGAVLTTVLDWATARNIGFSHCVALGDMTDVDCGDMLNYLANDYQTHAILLYIETISEARKFLSAARAAARNKPVIVVKAGRYAETMRPSAAGADGAYDDVYDAVFRRAGMLRVRDLQALFDAAETLTMTRQVTGDRLAIVTNGNGIGVMAADTLIYRDGRLAVLGQQTLDKLKQVLPSVSSLGNPVDIAGDAPDSCYGDALRVLDHEEQTDAVLLLHCPTALISATVAAQAVISALRTRKSSFRQKMVLTCWLGEESVEEARRIFTENHIPTYATPSEAVRGFMQVVRYRKSQEMLMETPPSLPETFTPDSARARQLVAKALAEDRPWLTGVESRALLSAYAIPCVEADAAASAQAHRPHAHELSVGMTEDARFGPVIQVGHGGAAAEVIGDRAFALPPLNMQLAHEVLARTRIYKLLRDYPGMPGADLDSIALTLMKISQLACDIAEIAELHINPLLADDQGVLALDGRVKVVKARGAAVHRLAIRPYPKELEETLCLPDGQALLIRPIRPEDEPGYQKIFAGLTPEEIRLRFLHPMNTMSHSLAARLTQIDYDREMSLVVEGKDQAGEKELYGVVQISADPDKERAEFAILIRHDMTGLGLGPMLLRRIIDYARGQGIGELFGDVLNDNKPMLKLCRVFGFKVTSDREDPGIMQVTLPLTPDG